MSPRTHPERSASRQALEARCRAGGLALTAQRRAILGVLAGRLDHPTADGVYEAASQALPGLSRATVYRALEALVGVGCLQRVLDPGSAARYDPNVDHHHHLICDRCGSIADLHEPLLGRLPLPAALTRRFAIRDFSVYFRGRCEACAATPLANRTDGGPL